MSIEQLPKDFSFPKNEEYILEKWAKEDTYNKLTKLRKDGPIFNFMDGPPFVSSKNLHYGHILISMIKDSVCRYKSMTGYNVKNVLGYDCHGLPIEMVISKQLNVFTKDEINNIGIDLYNQKCKEMIYNCSGEWIHIFDRVGRWANFTNNYKTMDINFMESVWWVFKQLWKKKLVYHGFKVMPYSTKCGTPLSNSEAGLNYKNIRETTITVMFPLKNDPTVKILAWTTTPWTLPSNLALCVNSTHIYVKLHDLETDGIYIMAKECISNYYSKKKKDMYKILETFTGQELYGVEYEPLYDCFAENRIFKIITDDFVNSKKIIKNKKEKKISKDQNKPEKIAGTGVVHIAPAFGVDDFDVCLKHGIIANNYKDIVCPVDDNGNFTDEVLKYSGIHVKKADPLIINEIKEIGKLFKKEDATHKYPYCWRTETPLIYKAVSSFFVAVEKIKIDMVKNNRKSTWIPENIGSNRFESWLQNAKDWGISRNRYFGTPIPIWVSDNLEEMVCIGSIKELEELSGETGIKDLHRESIDHLTIQSTKGNGLLRRVDDVFDCWFESGCVPFGQIHYPFENKNAFDNTEYLSDFIVEGLDQTRGWFYTLTVLATALFNKPAFKHVICAGLILAEDGEKMSKSKMNYPDPINIINKYGSDALRLYLLNSPTAKAEPLKFKDNDIFFVTKTFLPWLNGFKFFIEEYTRFVKKDQKLNIDDYKQTDNIMDKWILSKISTLLFKVKKEMNEYKLYNILPHLLDFIGELTNWYIRTNRDRLKGKNMSNKEWGIVLCTLYKTLYSFALIMAPFAPFLAETMYQKLKPVNESFHKTPESVHHCKMPSPDEFIRDSNIERRVKRLQDISVTVRSMRNDSKHATSIKMPLKNVIIGNSDSEFKNDIHIIKKYIQDEINTIEITVVPIDKYVSFDIEPVMKQIGRKYKKDAKKIIDALKKINYIDMDKHVDVDGYLNVKDEDNVFKLSSNEFTLVPVIIASLNNTDVVDISNNTLVIVDFEQNQEVFDLFFVRQFYGEIQELRKQNELHPWDRIKIYYSTPDVQLNKLFVKYKDAIQKVVMYDVISLNNKTDKVEFEETKIIIKESINVNNNIIKIIIIRDFDMH
jgi:isoleucyl-tRNA synthetase